MHTALPEEEGATSLNARIEARLAEIRNTEGNIPCVITIHDIRSWHLVYMSQRGLDYLDVSLESLRCFRTSFS